MVGGRGFFNTNFQTNIVTYLIFVISAFFVLLALLFVHPIMFFTDEWITGNQLHQLNEGSQILYNEGKYGYLLKGEQYSYFEIRKNSLPYSSYLPLASIPFLWGVLFIGDNLPYIITIIWISLAILVYALVKMFFPKYLNRSLDYCILITIFLFFIVNLFFFQQLPIIGDTESNEVLGVVLYHIFLYFFLAWILFLINRQLFNNSMFSIFGTILLLCCSSSLFWTSTLKDHLDIIFFISLLIYSIIKAIKTKDIWFSVVAFILTGIIIWIRPEYGSFIFLSLLIIFFPLRFLFISPGKLKSKLLTAISPAATIIGIVPFLLNNYLVMGNPFKTPWQLFKDNYGIINDTTSVSALYGKPDLGLINVCIDIFQKLSSLLIYRITPGGNVVSGLYSAFVSPETVKVPVLALTPIFGLSIILFPIIHMYLKKRISRDEWLIIISLSALSLGSIIAYLSSISGLGTSVGVFPDVRYLSPMYIPLNIIGVIILSKLSLRMIIIEKIIKNILLFSIFGIFLVTICSSFLNTTYDYIDFILWLNVITTILVFIFLGISFIILTMNCMGMIQEKYSVIPLALLITLPMVWQLSHLIFFSYYPNHHDQYPPLLPAMRAFLELVSTFTFTK